MIYLASPYSHPEPAVRVARYRATCAAAAALLRLGCVVFAPIVQGHPLVEFGVPIEWQFWRIFARWYLERCDLIVVLTLDGWRESISVQAELKIAHELGKPTRFVEPGLLYLPCSPTVGHAAGEG